MGFIKAIGTAVSGQMSDAYREVIRYQNNDKRLLIKKVTTENGVIQNESRLFVEPGQCAIYTDNGAIKDIITEPGMYFMDTQAPSLFQVNIFKGIGQTFLESMKRVAYKGKEITTQAVYFISLAEVTNINFKDEDKTLYKDPEWGTMEIGLEGTYGVRVSNPVNLLTNINSNKDECYLEEINGQINSYIESGLMVALNELTVSFDKIPSKINGTVKKVIEDINKKLDTIGMEVTRIVVSDVNIPEEIRKSLYERASIKMKATSVDSDEADIYTKLNTAEAIKDLANNSNNNGTSVMGMNLGNTVAGVINKNVEESQNNDSSNN